MVALTRRGQDVLTVVLAASGIGLLSVTWALTARGDSEPDPETSVSAGATPTEATPESLESPESPESQGATEQQNGRPAFVEDFENGLSQWRVVGSAAITDETSSHGRRSATLTSAECGGDAFSRPVAVEPGSTYRLQTDYRTDGDGGYVGLDQYDADGKRLREWWLIGDGGTPTQGDVRWRYNVDERDPKELGVWRQYTADYEVPDGVASVTIKIEDWGCGGLPDDPARAPVYFDRISWTLLSDGPA
jgi:hypothetical protein